MELVALAKLALSQFTDDRQARPRSASSMLGFRMPAPRAACLGRLGQLSGLSRLCHL